MQTKRIFLLAFLATLTAVAFGQTKDTVNHSQGVLRPLKLPYQKTGPLQTATPSRPVMGSTLTPAPETAIAISAPIQIADSALPIPLTDSTFQGLRLTGVSVLVAVPSWSLYTGTGISYERDVYSSSTKRWSTSWAVNIGAYLGGQFAPTTLKTVGAVGLSVALLNKFLVIGVLYNFAGPQHWQAATGGNASIIPTN